MTTSTPGPAPADARTGAGKGRPGGRAGALRQATAALHAQVDQSMMALRPFEDRAGYGRFLAVQYRFHQATAAYFRDPVLNGWFPGLSARERLAAVEQDCRDLGLDPASLRETPLPTPSGAAELAHAVGWLYVNEGSNLGAAFLYKHAERLGLDADCGARHLAAHPDGRAAHWQRFVAQLDDAPIAAADESAAVAGARAAFERVLLLARAAG